MDPKVIFNQHLKNVKPSVVGKFLEIANEYKEIISLSVGEPDFQTPWHIRQAGIEALEQGKTFYSPVRGLLALRQEISDYMFQRFETQYQPKTEILVTVGSSEAIEMAYRTLLNPGDEVLIVQPSYLVYEPMVYMAGAVPIIIETFEKDGFRLKPEQLKEKITSKSRLLILPYPCNPTGAIMEKVDLEAIAEVIRETDMLILSDEIYAELNYSEISHVSIASIEGMRERTIVTSGFSKAFAMTGWRIGYACAPEEIISAMTKYHQYAIMCAPTVSQFAGIEALKNGAGDIVAMRSEYNMRRRYIVDRLLKMGLSCYEPKGAFYVFPNISSTGLNSEEFCEKLLKQKQVAVIPGNAFGDSGEGFVRISYSFSLKHIIEAMNRMEEFIQELSQR
ncbi:MAG: aminotransferase class I/II-fold pyridoxal phosphate-dependent enzyme [Erysipelotrichaceae bacterium]|nr:aminotransferase class I/II-fold pyridoxal phosphate-dependent enzyme [Erysipelotrichaceae bacterium]